MDVLKEIKGVFVPPIKKYYVGKIVHGAPYMYPKHFERFIISIRKNKLQYKRNNSFNLFGYNITYGSPIIIDWHGIGWKDKFDSPRFEWSPSFYVFFFNWQFIIKWRSPGEPNELYYEMVLWWLYYSDKDIKIAEETWPWSNGKTKKSTWDNKYIIKSLRN